MSPRRPPTRRAVRRSLGALLGILRVVVLPGLLAVLLHLAGPSAEAQARRTACAPPTTERGTFRLYKLQAPVGHERYEARRSCDSVAVTTSWQFHYLGSDVRLEARATVGRELRPLSYVAKGATSTMTSVDVAVERRGDSLRIRQGPESRSVAAPAPFFATAHYPPLAVEELLFRYWKAHGSPPRLALLPAGEVSFERRGTDTVTADGQRVRLHRYSVDGLVWGRQSVWFDEDDRLIAVANGDAELDRFEGIREGFERMLPTVVARSISDGLADLERIARRVRPTRAGSFAIVGGRLVDGTGSPPVEDAVVLVRDGRIAAAGPRARVAIPPDVPRVDVAGATVLPGLWDMHGHYEQVEWPSAALAAGVTTVRDVANELELVTALRDAIDAGRALGPRMLLAGVIDGGEHALGVITANTADEARAVVGRYKTGGFRQIKVYQSLKPELVRVVADEAHRLGMTVTGHVPTGMNAFEFVEAGADQINHLGFVTAVMRSAPQPGQPAAPLDLASEVAQRAMRFFKERDTVIDPSLARGEQHAHPKDSSFALYEPGTAKAPLALREVLNSVGTPADVAPQAMRRLARSLDVVGALHAAGIPIVLGTDLVVPGHSIHRELELAVRAGLSPMDAIRAATAVPARAMGLEKESGTVEPGKRADLVIVAGNPLANISEIRRVRYVVTAGRMYEPGPLWQSAGFTP